METTAGPVLVLAGLLGHRRTGRPVRTVATIAVMTAVVAPARSILSRSMAVILAYARAGSRHGGLDDRQVIGNPCCTPYLAEFAPSRR